MPVSIANEIDQRFLEHGGRLDLARALYPDAPGPWMDLSTGISPWSYTVPHLGSEKFQCLPEGKELASLAAVARGAYHVPEAAEIVPLPGTDAGLSLLPWLFREPKRVVVLGPAYSGHAAAWIAAGHSVTEAASLDRALSAAVIIAVNPNNPDGRFLPHGQLAALLAPIKRRGGLLIVDEAFADADERHSLLPAAARLDHTLVLRSAGKFYGAGGVRLGFAITSHPVAGRLKAALGAWPVSTQAIAFGQAALADNAWAVAQRAKLKQAAERLDAVLAEGGFNILGGTVLFRLAGHPESKELFIRLARKGILTRPFKDRSALRFGIPPSPAELARLSEALQSVGIL
jgi:cobalamin biosynthesis protein CobC